MSLWCRLGLHDVEHWIVYDEVWPQERGHFESRCRRCRRVLSRLSRVDRLRAWWSEVSWRW